MNELILRLKEVSETKESAMQCGGSYSANRLRTCISLINEIEEYNDHPKYKEVLEILLIIKESWKSALIKHNSNDLKFIEYDVETGLHIEHGKNA